MLPGTAGGDSGEFPVYMILQKVNLKLRNPRLHLERHHIVQQADGLSRESPPSTANGEVIMEMVGIAVSKRRNSYIDYRRVHRG